MLLWLVTNAQAGGREYNISFQFSKPLGSWEPGSWALCSNVQAPQACWSSAAQQLGTGSCSVGSICYALEKEVGESAPTTWKGCAYFFFPWSRSSIVPVSLGSGHSKGRAPGPPGGWSAAVSSCICLHVTMNDGGSRAVPQVESLQTSGVGVKSCEELCFNFPSVPSDLENSELWMRRLQAGWIKQHPA